MRCPRGQAGVLALFAGYLVPGAVLGALLLAAPASDLVWAVTSPLPGPDGISETAFVVLYTAVMGVTVLGLWALARWSMRRSLRLANRANARDAVALWLESTDFDLTEVVDAGHSA